MARSYTQHPRRANRAEKAAGYYYAEMCANCHHPAGLHIIDEWEPRATHCRCCADCPIYVDGDYELWSNERTREMTAEARTLPARNDH